MRDFVFSVNNCNLLIWQVTRDDRAVIFHDDFIVTKEDVRIYASVSVLNSLVSSLMGKTQEFSFHFTGNHCRKVNHRSDVGGIPLLWLSKRWL